MPRRILSPTSAGILPTISIAISLETCLDHYQLKVMPPSFKRKRQSSAASVTSHPSRAASSRRRTPIVSFNLPLLASQPQSQHRRVTIASKPQLERGASSSQQPLLQNAQQSVVVDEDDTDETLDNVIMAIDMKEHGTVGCAYYVAREERLFCMEDVVHGGTDTVEALKLEIQPTVVLASLRIDSEGGEPQALRGLRQASLVDEAGDRLPLPYRVDYRPNPEFSYEGAKNKLANLQSILVDGDGVTFLIPGDSLTYDDGQGHDEFGSTSNQGKLLRISSWINFDSRVSLGCVGAVLISLQRKRSAEFLQDDPDDQQAYRITSMEMFSMQGTMFVNADTLLSLQIIQPESHPNPFNQGPGSTGSKESLSIYGLFHHLAHTPQGRARLRQLFLRPILDLEEINTRLDFVSVFVQQENVIPLEKLSKSLAKIKNMRVTTTLLRKGISGGNQKYGGFKSGVWASLLEFTYHTIDIRDTLREVIGGENLPLCAKAMDVLDVQKLQRIGKAVYEVVDLESSIEQHRIVVKRGVNERLDEIKNIYDGIDDLLSKAAVAITRILPADFEPSLNVIYFPQLGYHISVPINAETGQPVYDGGETPWERMFTTQNQAYFKDNRMREMDEQLGDLWAMICDIEIELAHNLAQTVLADEKLLIAVSDLCGELDWSDSSLYSAADKVPDRHFSLLALAHGASQYRLSRPRMTDENVIDIKAGRHLLQELTVPAFITNDAFIVGGRGDDFTSRTISDLPGPNMILLTGPNYSGKSVYQKQVALAVYMAHIGSFVPADAAIIGITDKILTRITTRETVSKTQSAFMIDLQQIALALNHATPRSLVIIDEFGKGTDSCDGAGLAAGVFNYLLSLGHLSPKVLAATHFHEIFTQGFLHTPSNLAFAHMEVLVNRKDKRREDDIATEVTYLYALRPGRSTLSYGTQCAAMNGIPAPIISRAASLANLACQGEDLVAVCAMMSPEEEEDLEDAEMTARAFLEQEFDELASSEDPRSALESVLGGSATGSVIVS